MNFNSLMLNLLFFGITVLVLIRSLEESELGIIHGRKTINFDNDEPVSVLTVGSTPSSSSVSSQFDGEKNFIDSLENVTNADNGRHIQEAVVHSSDRRRGEEQEGILSDESAVIHDGIDNQSIKCTISIEPDESPSTESSCEIQSASDDLELANKSMPVIHEAGENVKEPMAAVVPPPVATHQEDIPSFREWTEKHLAEEEKEKEENNAANISSKVTKRKVQKKNFASLDCGAKLVAANPEAKSAGSLLSPTRDEYLLSSCNSRIWFVVELCEAVQVNVVELANFELFSSSPKEFSVLVSDRFPSRDWSLLGQFEAKDEKSVQSFNLQATHFTKYIKVEIHSHYGQEHFCPVSLFRVYGTSELEILETVDDGQPGIESDSIDVDDEFSDSVSNVGEKDIFGSARDAVINIVRKAAEVLVNSPSQNKKSTNDSDAVVTENKTEEIAPMKKYCVTPRYYLICNNCNETLFSRVYEFASCSVPTLDILSRIRHILRPIRIYDVCYRFGINLPYYENLDKSEFLKSDYDMYWLKFFSEPFIAALCNIIMLSDDLRYYGNRTINSTYSNEQLNYTNTEQTLETMNTDTHRTTTMSISPGGLDGNNQFNSQSTYTISDTILTSSDGQPYHIVHDQLKPTKTFNKEVNISFVENSIHTADNENNRSTVAAKGVHSPVNALAQEASNDTTVNGKESKEVEHNADVIPDDSTSIDTLISELERGEEDANQPPLPTITSAASTNQKPQIKKESVFVRLANRIKALERNISLSGQYLEELSRRYKKQVEDLQRLFTDVAEDRQRNKEREEKHSQEVDVLVTQIADLTVKVKSLISERDSWSYKALMIGEHSIIIMLEIFLLVGLMVLCRGIPSVEISQRKISIEWMQRRNSKSSSKNVNRRQSADNIISQSPKIVHKRRPSEEALRIDGSTHQDLLITDIGRSAKSENRRKRKKRRELLLKSSENAINLEVGGDIIYNNKAKSSNATSSHVMQRSSSEIFQPTADINLDKSKKPIVNGQPNFTPAFINSNTASSVRKFRSLHYKNNNSNNNNNNNNQEYVAETSSSQISHPSQVDRTSDRDVTSVSNSPSIKEKKRNGIKKVVKKFF